MDNNCDWFDAKNKNHIQAYYNLGITGLWDNGLCPRPAEIPSIWSIIIIHKIANAYIETILFPEKELVMTDLEWCKELPSEPGVYIIRHNEGGFYEYYIDYLSYKDGVMYSKVTHYPVKLENNEEILNLNLDDIVKERFVDRLFNRMI